MRLVASLILAFLARGAAATTFTLNLSTSGPVSVSSVTSSPAGISCAPTCSASFAAGSTVTLTAFSASTVTFAGWSGPGSCSTNFPTCRVLMSANAVVSATYNSGLLVSALGNGAGTVTDASGTITCASLGNCANGAAVGQAYPTTAVVTLTASPAPNSSFDGWSGDCSGTGTCVLHMTAPHAVQAAFDSTGPFTITVSTAGTGVGHVDSTPPGIDCGGSRTVCTASFAANTSITLAAFPEGSSAFAGWSGASCSGTGTCVITSTSAAQSTGGPASPSATFY